MESMGLNEIREKYLSFFESKGHLRLPSFSLVPHNDPSVLLINAGMTPLKPYFTGAQTPPRTRVTTCQKCIRTPDIERVGHTARHGTYFEMLGNFSFGDYFKKEVIPWAWELVTDVFKMDPERIHVTVYLDDDEAYDLWHHTVGLPESHITRLGKEDNFWEHGTGPCGPCSEIFYDRGIEHGCGKDNCGVTCDCDRFIEFWNLVFSQFDRQADGTYLPLKQKNIDTGAGLERLACIMQDVDNLFETDTVRAVLNKVCEIAGVKYDQDHQTDVAIRVITDHIRSTTMMISDGILPSNEGRGYVLRRLLRRAARYGRLLGVDRPFLNELTPIVIKESETAYPELAERKDYILQVIAREEERFARTIKQGSVILDEKIQQARAQGQTELEGKEVFLLHDTYGFPFDLTREIAAEAGLTVDKDGFDEQMKNQRNQARAALKARGGSAWSDRSLPAETASLPATVFDGYDSLEESSELLMILQKDEDTDQYQAVPSAVEGSEVLLIFDRTPFYAESGGQVGDRGLAATDTCQAEIQETRKTAEGLYLHAAVVRQGLLLNAQSLQLKVDAPSRWDTARNHSCTHLLHKALRTVLGSHVTQAGSEVNPQHLRFDFTHFQPLTAEELRQVAQLVNEAILADYPVTTQVMSLEEAKASGAMALFNEKYKDKVRVVSMGDYSRELCGGTHLTHTSQAGSFYILSESSVASGVRRIEAVTGHAALRLTQGLQDTVQDLATDLKTTPSDLKARVQNNLNELRRLTRELQNLENRAAGQKAEKLKESAKDIDGVHLLTAEVEVASADALRDMAAMLRDSLAPAVILLAAILDGRVQLVAMASGEAVKAGIHCGKLIKVAAQTAGGNGGGRPDMAQAGGKDVSKVSDAMAAAEVEALLQLKH
ncbi:alanine--tRNA ligase [Oscillospiraceae bacterium HV4-5-C5C]|nr:alanine--tRNA ligase [Oscillospiraceae bacterium HV4-5-C5C]